jgi:hypothetical protein
VANVVGMVGADLRRDASFGAGKRPRVQRLVPRAHSPDRQSASG